MKKTGLSEEADFHPEQELSDFFMQAPAPIAVLLGSDYRYAFANSHYHQLVDGRNVVGKKLLDVFPREQIADFVDKLDVVYKTGVPYSGQEIPLNIPDLNGVVKKRWINVGYHPFLRKDRTIKGILAIHQDVTSQVMARKNVENERENFRNLFRQTPEMVCILKGPDHVFEFVNEAHVRALGFDATGMAVRVAQPESVEVHGILDDVYRTGKTAELHEIPVTVTDRLRYFNLTYSARRNSDGVINGVMILGVECTEQVQTREELKTAIRARDEFLSIASHELKTPLTSLKMNVQLAEKRLRQATSFDDTKRIARDFAASNNQITRMTTLIDDLLDISRVQAGKLHYNFEYCDFAELFDEVVERFGEQLQNSNTELRSDIEENLIGFWDKARLEQVLVNLLSNAIKYAPGSPIVVSAKRKGQEVEISFQDFGDGIPRDKSEKIFDRFERIGNVNSVSGLGLGLYISREIVTAHHGTLKLDPSVRQGARFMVNVPFDSRNAASS